MPTETYTTAHGDVLTLNLTAEEAAWFIRFRMQAADPTVSSGQLIDDAYADTNPLLVESPIPGRGWGTREVHARPAYQALLDVIYQKTAQETGGRAEERFTVTVASAAAELGISEAAVRSAMRNGKLPSMRKGRRLTSPEAVAGYQVSNRGPRSEARERRQAVPALRAKWGSENVDGVKYVLHISHDGRVEERDGDRYIVGWTRIRLRSTIKDSNTHRYRELAPAPTSTERQFTCGTMGVWGAFTFEEGKDGKAALDAWKARPR